MSGEKNNQIQDSYLYSVMAFVKFQQVIGKYPCFLPYKEIECHVKYRGVQKSLTQTS